MTQQDTNKDESKVEVAKRESRHLRGTIAEVLASDATHFEHDDVQLLKFHGTYQQDDRDQRAERRKQGLETAYSFMVRCAIPAGVLTGEQYLALDELADEHTNESLRVTTRQGIQLHGVLKSNLKATLAGINHSLLTTLSACGDVERNVMACPAPLADEAHRTMRRTAREIATQLRPASRAYHEIWLDGEKCVTTEDEEPFYGDLYLPRKFKSAITLAGENSIDIHSYDLGLIMILKNGAVAGYDVLVGGGMGMTHNKADTFASLAVPLGFVGAEHAVETARTVAGVFRDHGNRADRRHARLKYLIAERGIEWFQQEFRRRVEFELAPWRSVPRPTVGDHLGRHPQGDGKWFYGINVENGRIIDRNGERIKTGLREIVSKYRPGLSLTPGQNVLLTDLEEADLDGIEGMMVDHGIKRAEDLSAARRYAMACPALPTCGLAMADSERIMPSVLDRFEAELVSLGLREVPITIRMTGCPNGCTRPYTADISFVGRRPDVYHVYVGGGQEGDRMVDLYAADVKTEDMVTTLRPLLTSWAKNRGPSESLSDYYQKLVARGEPRMSISGKEEPTIKTVEARLNGA